MLFSEFDGITHFFIKKSGKGNGLGYGNFNNRRHSVSWRILPAFNKGFSIFGYSYVKTAFIFRFRGSTVGRNMFGNKNVIGHGWMTGSAPAAFRSTGGRSTTELHPPNLFLLPTYGFQL